MKFLFTVLVVLFSGLSLMAQLEREPSKNINYSLSSQDEIVVGEGEPIIEKRTINYRFNELIVGNGIQAYISSDATNEIQVVAQKDILPLISTEIVANKLVVSISGALQTTKGIKVYVPMGELAEITMKEGSYLYLEDEKIANLTLNLQSGSIANCDIIAQHFDCTVMGGSSLSIEGQVIGDADILVKGGSILKGSNLVCNTTNVTVLGASKCDLNVEKSLSMQVENYSTFKYKGNPVILKKTTTGKSKIKHRRL